MDRDNTPPTIDSERFVDIESDWRELHRAAGAPPFSHPAWVRTWLQAPDEGSVIFLAVRRSGELIGVAPIAPGLETARPAGDANVFDFNPILAARGEETSVHLGVLEWLREDMTTEFVEWGCPEPPSADLVEGAANLGWTVTVADEAVAPRIDLPDDFETYVAGLSKKDRHELRRKLRNFDGAGEATFAVARSGAEFDQALVGLIEMMAESHEEKGAFLDTFGDFFGRVARAMAEEGVAAVSTLSLDGRAAGRILTFESGGVCYLYNSGYDPEFSHLAAGLISKAYVLRDAIGRGFHCFDFLRGDEEYKRRLGGDRRTIVTATFRQR